MFRPLIIGPTEEASIKTLIDKAAANVMPLDDVLRMAGLRAEGQVTWRPNIEHTIIIPHGYHVTYTQEEQPTCVCRHISISVADAEPGLGPSQDAAAMIIAAFGFHNHIGQMPMWLTHDGDRLIVEFLEPIDGDVNRLRRPEMN